MTGAVRRYSGGTIRRSRFWSSWHRWKASGRLLVGLGTTISFTVAVLGGDGLGLSVPAQGAVIAIAWAGLVWAELFPPAEPRSEDSTNSDAET